MQALVVKQHTAVFTAELIKFSVLNWRAQLMQRMSQGTSLSEGTVLKGLELDIIVDLGDLGRGFNPGQLYFDNYDTTSCCYKGTA
jgi:hypothetical protein